MPITACFECGRPATFDHHVVPKSKGGTKTVPLCETCHAKVHGRRMSHTSELTRNALAHKKVKGERLGTTPLGYKSGGGELVPDPAEQKILRAIKRLRKQGLSLRAVARRLNERGMPTKRGGRWYASTVRYLDQHMRKAA